MGSLHPIDWTIILAFFGLTLIVGLIMTRRASSSLDHYFLAGRSLPWYLLGIAGMTNWFDMTGTMIITSFLFMLGPRGLFIEFRGGAVLILAFMMVYAGKWHRRSGCMTGAEWMTYRFGTTGAATTVRVLTAATTLIWTVGALGYLMKGCTLFMAMAVPGLNTWWTTAAIILISTVYTVAAGFYGVVLTDLLQGIIIIVGCLFVTLQAWAQVPDAAALGALAEQVTGNPQWLSSVPHVHTAMPPGYEVYESLLVFALFYLLRNVLFGMGSGGENRYFGARSDRDCGLQSLLQGLTVAFRWPMMMGFAVLGIYLVQSLYPDRTVVEQAATLIRQHYPDKTQAEWSEFMTCIARQPEEFAPEVISGLENLFGSAWPNRVLLVGYHGTVNPEQILPAVLIHCLPVGLKGFLLVAMLAALMSTFTGTTNGAGALFVRDVYQVLVRPRAQRRELILVSYGSTLGLVVGGCLMCAAAKNINDIWAWLIMGLGSGSLAGILRFYWWRCNDWGMVGGTLFGGFAAVLQRLFLPSMWQFDRLSAGAQQWAGAHLPAGIVRLLHTPWEWQAFTVITALSFGGLLVMTLMTPPTERTVLEHFYRTTRPFGWWGPIRRAIEPELLARIDRENRNDMIAIPFALLGQIALFLLPMQLVIKTYDAAWATLPLLVVAAVGLYIFWYRQLPAYQPRPAAPAGPVAASSR